MLWIDSHAHLTMFEMDEVSAVLERATAKQVHGVLVPATSRDDLETTYRLAGTTPRRWLPRSGSILTKPPRSTPD
jgi:Tat protein secretion system quality control protein TatD with DNase activity